MSAPAPTRPGAPPAHAGPAAHRPAPSSVVLILQVFALALLVIPSNTTLSVVGAAGFPAGLIGIAAMCAYGAWTLSGDHRPGDHRYPTRIAFVVLWLSSLASYIASQFRERSAIEVTGADRWLLFLMAMTGVALLAAEGLRTVDELLRVLRVLVWAGAICGAVALLQFTAGYDLAPQIGQAIPGFTYNGDLGGIQARGALNRVPGTTLHPIELGAVTALLLPLAVVLAIVDRHRSALARYVPLALLVLCVPASVSRSAIVALVVALVVFVVQVRASIRVVVLAFVPVCLAGVFLLVRGFLRTISEFFLNASTDSSVTTRTDDYGMVEGLVARHPWFGIGGGTYLPQDLLTILDNTYLKWVTEFGLVGLVTLVVFYMGLPVVAAVTVRRRATDERLALLAAALGAGLAAAAVSAVTFDSLAFPTLACLQALAVGLVGAVWQLALRGRTRAVPARGTLVEERMDTLNVVRALRRNRRTVIPVLLLAALLAVAVQYVVPRGYTSTSTVLMVPPPPAPTDAQIAERPSLGGLDSDNPFTRQYDPTTMIAVISLSIGSEPGRAAIRRAGGTDSFRIDQIVRYGIATPFMQVVAHGATADEAVRTNRLVIDALRADLDRIQRKDGPSERYFITAPVIQEPTEVAAVEGTTWRLLVAVALLATFLLFAVVAVGDAVRESRREQHASLAGDPSPGRPGRRSPKLGMRPRRADARSGRTVGSEEPIEPGGSPQWT